MIADAYAGENVWRGGSGGRGEEEKTDECQDGSDGDGPARGVCVGGADGWEDVENRNEDDDEAGDESGFRWCGAGEASGLELIACGEEDAYYYA